jgi:hypothetical protein
VQELATSEVEKETAHGVRVMDVGALTILGTIPRTDQKSKMMVINLDQLAPYDGTTQDGRF